MLFGYSSCYTIILAAPVDVCQLAAPPLLFGKKRPCRCLSISGSAAVVWKEAALPLSTTAAIARSASCINSFLFAVSLEVEPSGFAEISNPMEKNKKVVLYEMCVCDGSSPRLAGTSKKTQDVCLTPLVPDIGAGWKLCCGETSVKLANSPSELFAVTNIARYAQPVKYWRMTVEDAGVNLFFRHIRENHVVCFRPTVSKPYQLDIVVERGIVKYEAVNPLTGNCEVVGECIFSDTIGSLKANIRRDAIANKKMTENWIIHLVNPDMCELSDRTKLKNLFGLDAAVKAKARARASSMRAMKKAKISEE